MDNLIVNSQKGHLEKIVFWPSFGILLFVVIFSFARYEKFTDLMYVGFVTVTNNWGWFLGVVMLTIFCLLIYLMFSKKGDIKFGGQDSTPEYTNWQFFTMALCSGIAIGIVFWAVYEPMYHWMTPAPVYGLEAGSYQAAVNGLATAFLHWTIIYSLYTVCGLAIALAYYNYNMPFAVSSSLLFIAGRNACNGWLGKIVNILAVMAIILGVVSSLGFGAQQLGSGLEILLGIKFGPIALMLLLALITVGFTISAYTGVDRGIKFLSDQNMKLYIIIGIFIFLLGPTFQICSMTFEGFGHLMNNLLDKMTYLDSFGGENRWTPWWTTFFWACAFVYAPVVGMFLARLGRGRSIRSFIIVNVICPAVFAIIWFGIFGSAAIWFQHTGYADIWSEVVAGGKEGATFAFLMLFPGGKFWILIFCVAIYVSFVTCADSMTNCVASMCTKGMEFTGGRTEEPPKYLKLAWGIMIGILGWVFMSFAGLDGVQWMCNLNGFPCTFLVFAIMISFIKGLWWPDVRVFRKKAKKITN